MGEYNTVFRRYEKKFLLDGKQYRAFCKRIEPYMQVDEYGESTICNIYYDTDDYQLIRSSIDKPVYKEKLRLRSYGTPKYGDTVFLEIKKKTCGNEAGGCVPESADRAHDRRRWTDFE